LEAKTGEEWTAFAFAGLLDSQRLGEEADERRLKPSTTGATVERQI